MKKAIILFVLLAPAIFMAFKTPSMLTVTSTAFKPNGMIPAKYTCEGAGVSPPLQVSDIPSYAKSLAIIVHDPDAPHAGGVTHWVVFNLPVDGNIPEDFKGGVQGLNTANKQGYKGMCPPTGTHHYHFMVYALNKMLTLDTTANKAMQGHIMASGELVGLYMKGAK